MAIYEFKLPDIGEGVVEGEVVTWHVSVGDTVSEDDAVVDRQGHGYHTVPNRWNGSVPERGSWRHDCSWLSIN